MCRYTPAQRDELLSLFEMGQWGPRGGVKAFAAYLGVPRHVMQRSIREAMDRRLAAQVRR